MRPKGSAKELEQRRRRALALLKQGMRPAQVARAVGTSRASVTRWRQAYELPMAVEVTAGQVHESTRFESVIKAAPILRCRKRPRRRPKGVAGDKGYSYSRIRAWLRRHKIKAIIPQREDQRERGELAFDKQAYRRRSISIGVPSALISAASCGSVAGAARSKLPSGYIVTSPDAHTTYSVSRAGAPGGRSS